MGLLRLLLTIFVVTYHGVSCAKEVKETKLQTSYSYGEMKVSKEPFPVDPLTPPAPSDTQAFCFVYPEQVYNLSAVSPNVYMLENFTYFDPCDGTYLPPSSNKSTILLMKHSNANCSIQNYLNFTREQGALGLIVISTKYYELNETEELGFFAIVGIGAQSKLKDFGNKAYIQFLDVSETSFSPGILLLLLLACFCVAAGALTGPYYNPHTQRRSSTAHQQILDGDGNDVVVPESKSVLPAHFSVGFVFLIVLVISAGLLSMYFFYEYIVYIVMTIYCIGTTRAMYEILVQILTLCHMDERMPKVKGCGIHKLILIVISTSLQITWILLRHQDYIWIISNAFGVCFCIHVVQMVKIPNLKFCTMLLWLLFFYDIFFVFITPYITKDGKSVMVEVATGGGSGEILPLLLQVPNLSATLCHTSGFSLLGFGDIILPGMLICFANTFDVVRGDRFKPYFTTGMIGYCIGLILAFVALYVTRIGQPALLYIVPCTLFPLYIVSLCRSQFKQMWNGVATRAPEANN